MTRTFFIKKMENQMMTNNRNTVDSAEQRQTETKNKQVLVDNSERKQWIEESAYFMAEARGFIPGYEQKDWDMAIKQYENTDNYHK